MPHTLIEPAAITSVAIEPHITASAGQAAIGSLSDYAPGSIGWIELQTADLAAAKRFYTQLFGWSAIDQPMPSPDESTLWTLNDRSVAGFSRREVGATWSSWVVVEDVDAVSTRAADLGATILVAPLDSLDAGRMAILADPHGAVFALWQPLSRATPGLVRTAGAFSWDELVTVDVSAAVEFYRELFGWVVDYPAGTEFEYALLSDGREPFGGIRARLAKEPAYWLVQFGVEHLDAALATTRRLGGNVLYEPTDLGGGVAAIVEDPQGAVFGLRHVAASARPSTTAGAASG